MFRARLQASPLAATAVVVVALFACFAAVLLDSGHRGAESSQPGATPRLPPFPAGYGAIPLRPAFPTRFVDETAAAGIGYRWALQGRPPRTILQTIGNGCAFFDFDNDGNLDILLVGPRLALYRGDGRGHFTDVTHATHLDRFHGNFLGCAIGDYDNDGFDDIFLTGYHTAKLLHNERGKFFTDATAGSGIRTDGWSTSAAWGDFAGTGKLGLYVCEYVAYGADAPQRCRYGRLMLGCGPNHYAAEHGVLYEGDGHGHFRDVTAQWRAGRDAGKNLGAAFADYDGSGRQSLFVASDQQPAGLYRNEGSTFTDVAAAAGLALRADGQPYSGMGVDWCDFDQSGRLSLAVMDFSGEDKGIYANAGGGLFVNEAQALGLHAPLWPYVSFGVKWIDYDNDGWPGLVCTNGNTDDLARLINPVPDRFRQPILLFHNDAGRSFANVSAGLLGRASRRIVGRGLAIGDDENDGRMDILAVDSSGAPLLLRNATAPIGHWLDIALVGVRSNRDGYGALITARVGRQSLLGLCHSDGSYMSSSDRRVHFGLGAATRVDELIVHWPSGEVDRYHNVDADRVVTIAEGESASRVH